jgi:NAD(P)-dependent dehydrogenase (short-subunit alcohol dehydrogenase family)
VTSLTGRTAVVTGGNSGIGLAMATGLAKSDARVAIWARDATRSAGAVEQLRELGAEAIAASCDVTSEKSVDAALARTVTELGPIDILVANAGVADAKPLIQTSLDDWHRVLRTNLDGTFLCVRAVSRHLVERQSGGSIIIVSSTINRYGATGQAAYATSKTGLMGLGRTVAVELARLRVRCNILTPGWFLTPMNQHLYNNERFLAATTQRTPARRWADPSELEKTIAFLADPELTFHTGNEVVVDGGYTMF